MKNTCCFAIILFYGLSVQGQTSKPDSYTLAVTYTWNTFANDWRCADSVFYDRYSNGRVNKTWLVYCDQTATYQKSDYHHSYDSCGRLTASKLQGPKTDYSYSYYSYNQSGETLGFTNTHKYNSATVTRKIDLLSAGYTGNILSNKLERHLLIPPNSIPPIKTFVRYTNTLDSGGRIGTCQIESSTDSVNFSLDTTITIAYNSSGQPVEVIIATSTSTVKYSGIVWENWCPGFTNTTGTRFTYPCPACEPVMGEMMLQSWDTTALDFVPVYRKKITSGTQNELINTTETYDKNSHNWSMYERTTHFFNNNGDPSKVVYESAHLASYSELFVYLNGKLAEKYTTDAAGDSVGLVRYFPGFVTSIEERSRQDLFSIWPNPAEDLLHVSYPFSGAGTLTMYDLQGKIFLESKIDQHTTTLDVGHLPRSLFFVIITGPENLHITKKIVLGPTR